MKSVEEKPAENSILLSEKTKSLEQAVTEVEQDYLNAANQALEGLEQLRKEELAKKNALKAKIWEPRRKRFWAIVGLPFRLIFYPFQIAWDIIEETLSFLSKIDEENEKNKKVARNIDEQNQLDWDEADKKTKPIATNKIDCQNGSHLWDGKTLKCTVCGITRSSYEGYIALYTEEGRKKLVDAMMKPFCAANPRATIEETKDSPVRASEPRENCPHIILRS